MRSTQTVAFFVSLGFEFFLFGAEPTGQPIASESGVPAKDETKAIAAIVEQLRSSELPQKQIAVAKFATLFPQLQHAMKRSKIGQVWMTREEMRSIQDELIACVQSDNAQLRAVAARALAYSGVRSERFEQVLLSALKNEKNEEYRRDLIDSVSAAGYQSGELLGICVEMLRLKSLQSRAMARQVIVRITSDGDIPKLLRLLGGEQETDREIVRLLRSFGPGLNSAQPELISLSDSNRLKSETRDDLRALVEQIKAGTLEDQRQPIDPPVDLAR